MLLTCVILQSSYLYLLHISRDSGPILAKLDPKHHWVKEIQLRHNSFAWGDNSDIETI